MVYGNHDIVKRNKSYMQRHCGCYYCDAAHQVQSLFPDISVREGLIFRNRKDGKEIFMVHGHQGDFLNDTLWPVSRFLVRYVWRYMELIGFLDPTGAGRPRKAKERIEKRLADYGSSRKKILIAGHTHRPAFSKPGEGTYFNSGSCVHPRCITCIEIEDNRISLVKWSVRSGEDRILRVEREVLEDPVSLTEYAAAEK